MDFMDSPKTSREVLKLIRSVEQLSAADQDRILRLVRLLAAAPAPVQRASQGMLRELLADRPGTVLECIAGVDEVIEYLEGETAAYGGSDGDPFALAVGAGRPN